MLKGKWMVLPQMAESVIHFPPSLIPTPSSLVMESCLGTQQETTCPSLCCS